MVEYATQRTVSLPRDRAFEQWKNAMSTLRRLDPGRFKEFRVLRENGNERVTFCKEVWAGKTYAYTTHEDLSPPGGAVQTVIEGAGKGTVSRWTFEPVPTGTRIRAEFRLRGSMAFFMVLFRKEFTKEFEGSLDRFKKAIETA